MYVCLVAGRRNILGDIAQKGRAQTRSLFGSQWRHEPGFRPPRLWRFRHDSNRAGLDLRDIPHGVASIAARPAIVIRARALCAPFASPFSKSPSIWPIWFVTCAKHRTFFPRAFAKA